MLFFIPTFIIIFSNAVGKEFGKNPENLCKIAINKNSDYQALGIMAAPLNQNGILLLHMFCMEGNV